MNKLSCFVTFSLILILGVPSLAKPDLSKIYGKIEVVDSFPDYKVQVVSSFPDLKVQKVTSFPSSPGKWEFVDSFPDYKIQFVTSFPDFKIQYVTSFPGVVTPTGTSPMSSKPAPPPAKPENPRTIREKDSVRPQKPVVKSPQPVVTEQPEIQTRVGEEVFAPLRSDLFLGRITKVNGTQATVEYGDGSLQDVPLGNCIKAKDHKFKLGTKVRAKYKSGRVETGKVLARGRGTYFIQWDSGASPYEVEARYVLPLR